MEKKDKSSLGYRKEQLKSEIREKEELEELVEQVQQEQAIQQEQSAQNVQVGPLELEQQELVEPEKVQQEQTAAQEQEDKGKPEILKTDEQVEQKELAKFELVEGDKSEIPAREEQPELERDELIEPQQDRQKQAIQQEQPETQDQPAAQEQVVSQNPQHENQQEQGEQKKEDNILVFFICPKCRKKILKLIRPEDLEKAKLFEGQHKSVEPVKCNGIVKFFKIKDDNVGETSEKNSAFLENAEFFHDPEKIPYMVYRENGIRFIQEMDREFRGTFAHLYIEQYGYMKPKEIYELYDMLKSRAGHVGKEIKLHVRIARKDGAIWYDLCNGNGEAVKITANGWSIEEPPILFKRFQHQQPQVTPKSGTLGKDIDRLFDIIILKNRDVELLFKVSLISKFIPDFPPPIDVIFGAQGSSKSSIDRLKKSMVDPSMMLLSSLPSNMKELIDMASHHLVITFDNISGKMREWQCDTLCRISTGQGIQTRKLYTNNKEVIKFFRNSICLNGINNPVHRPDLQSRCIFFELEPLPDVKRKPEDKLNELFEEIKPGVLGSIFDIIVTAMRIKPTVTLPEYPRMADFAIWGHCIAEAMEPGGGERFNRILTENIKEKTIDALDSDITGECIRLFMEVPENKINGWEGTSTELYEELWKIEQTLGISFNHKDFPDSAIALGKKINELIINLGSVGIIIERFRERRYSIMNGSKVERLIRITYVGTD